MGVNQIVGSTEEFKAIVDSTGALKVSGAVTSSGTVTATQGNAGTAAQGWFVRVTDGTDTALVTATGALNTTLYSSNGNVISAEPDVNSAYHLDVQLGDTDVKPTLTAVTGNANGATVDGRTGRKNFTVIAVGTDTLAGTLTIEGSHDASAWVSSGATVALTAAATVVVTSAVHCFRFWRCSLSGASGAGSVTATGMLV